MSCCRPLMLAGALALFATTAGAKVSGHCRYEDRRVDFVDGVAWILPAEEDPFGRTDDEGNPLPPATPTRQLVFTTFALDGGAIARATDRDDAVRDQTWDQDSAARLELVLAPDDRVITSQFLWLSPGTSLSYGSNEVGKLGLRAADDQRVAASYQYTDDDAEGPACELDFDLRLLGDAKDAPPPPGQPLPAGGGDAGKAYLALNAALRAGDVDTLAKLLPPERAAEMLAARDGPDFAEQLAFMQAMTPEKVQITGGRQDGDRAWLEFTAVEGGAPRAGSAEMKRVDGRWQMVRESTRDPD